MTTQRHSLLGGKSSIWAVALLGAAISFSTAQAAVLVNADFDSGYTTGSLVGQFGTSDVGLSGTFAAGAATATASVVDSSTGGRNLTYSVVGGGTINGGSHSVDISGAMGVTQDVFHRSLSSTITGQTLYMRTVLRPVTAINDSTFLRFYMAPAAPAENALGGSGGGAFGLRGAGGTGPGANAMMNGASANTAAGALTLGQANLLVAAFNWNASTSLYDSVSIWVNPTATASGTPTATIAVTPFSPTLSVMGLGIINFNAGQIIAMDSFAVGTEWSDVVAVPEPSVGLLLVGGLSVLAGWRRRQTNQLTV